MSKEEFFLKLGLVFEMFTRQISVDSVKLMANMMLQKGYSYEAILKAAQEHSEISEYPPTPKTLLDQLEKGKTKRHGLSHEEILAAWRMKNTVFGILCRTVITSFDIENMSDSGLRQKTAQIKMLINDWEQRADRLDYTQHERQLLIKYNVVPNQGLFNDKKLDVDATSLKLEYQADRDRKNAEQPAPEKKVNTEAKEKIREMLRGL